MLDWCRDCSGVPTFISPKPPVPPKMTFAEYARRRTKTSIDALLNQLSDSARQDLDGLRAAFDQRIAAVTASLTGPDQSGSLEPMVEDLLRAAVEQAEAAASRARLESQEVARTQLVAAQAEAQSRLDAELASNAALRENLKKAQQQGHSLQNEVAAIQKARATIETQLEQGQTARAELANALADVQREAATLRDDVQARAVSLAAVEARLHLLEGERAQLQQTRKEAEARLDVATRERMALAEALEDAQEAASLARAETESCREEIEAATQNVKETHERLEAEIQALRDERRRGGLALEALDRVRGALHAFDAVTSGSDLLETFVAQLGREFDRAAIFLVRGHSLEGWRSVGLDPTTNIENLAVPLTLDSPLTRAISDRTSAILSENPEGTTVGLLGGSASCAIAIPILAAERVVAVAYAEHAQDLQGDAADAGLKIADILGYHVSRCLTAIATRAPADQPDFAAPLDEAWSERLDRAEASPLASLRPTASDAPRLYTGPARQAPRVRMPAGIEVLVDSSVSLLVDLSSGGAQVLSPKAMRPNYTVRLVLPREEGALPCNGRIVWAAFEVSRVSGTALYRAGVQFIDVDARALNNFLVRHGRDTSAPHNNLAAR